MPKELLDSDKVNYLIWRYLQESNYLDTAAHLEKEWNVEQPQQKFDFAPHVKHHALVHVLQRGLLYNEAERNERQGHDEGVEQLGFFGPLTLLSHPALTAASQDDNFGSIRKRQIEAPQVDSQVQTDSPAKRVRLSNGYDNGFDSVPVPMDVDEQTNGNGQAYPSPKEVERPLTPIITTNGPAQGTQVEKVTELSSDTTFLGLGEDPSFSKTIILHCEWSPTDSAILTAAGSDALVRLWTMSRAINDDHVNATGVSPPFQDIGEDEPAPNTSVTALAWSPDGSTFAVATESVDNDFGKVGIWTTDGTHVHTFSGFEPPVIALKWNYTSQLILAIMPDKEGTCISVFSLVSQLSITYSMSRHDPDEPLEVVWTGEYEFIVCGGEILWAFQCSDGAINLTKKYETRQDHGLSQIAHDPHTGLFATANESGTIDIWDQQGNSHSISAHQGAIVSLLWQPISPHSILDANSERLLASSGEDGIISIWNARAESKAKCSMTMDSAVVALAYTPDGAFIAGATSKQILIWKADDVSIPKARWIRGTEPGWASPRTSETSRDEDHHCLCWDADGHKLAYAVNCQLAVMRWRPTIESQVT